MLNTKIQNSSFIIKISLGVLCVMILALICPVVPSDIHAEGKVVHDVNATVSTNINSAVSVALQSRVDIDVYPEGKNTFNYETAKLTITTNSVDGYSIYLYTNETTANLVNPEDYNARILPVDSQTGSTPTNFATNTWGYNLSETGISNDSIFKAVPLATDISSQDAIQKTSTTAKADTYNLSFGVNVAPDLPAGQYSSNVVVSVVVNPSQIRSLTQLTYMQDMTDVICANSVVGASKQLVDIRDGRLYWVEKLADNNCWMTQNLALTFKDFNDGEGIRSVTESGNKGAIINATNTDITSAWVSPSETLSAPSSVGSIPSSWNIGKYVLATPTETILCANQTGADPLANCALSGFVDVSDISKWSTNFQAQIGFWNEKEQIIAAQLTDPNDDKQGGSYDAHYLVGNYYTIDIATAGTVVVNTIANSSICPKNWKLPNDEYKTMLEKYGLSTEVMGQVNNVNYNIALTPIYFVRSGLMQQTGTLTTSGTTGYYLKPYYRYYNYHDYVQWISFDNSKVNTDATTATSASPNPRYNGFSVRCITR